MVISAARPGIVASILSAATVVLLVSFGEAEAQTSRRAVAASAKSFSAERFVRSFRSNPDEANLQALSEVERLHRDEADFPDALWSLIQPARDGKTKVTPALLAVVRSYAGRANEKHAARQLALVGAADVRIALAAAEGLAGRQAEGALAPIAALRKRPEYAKFYGVRRAVLAAMAKYDTREAVDGLVETLTQSSGQLRYEAARELARLTGQNFGGKSDEWRGWWSSHRAEFVAAEPALDPVAAAAAADMPWDQAVPKFYGVPIFADRVVFVVDASKSMQSSVDGVTRLDDAQRELEQAIRGLPEGKHFNLIAYNVMAKLCSPHLVPANDQTRSDALRFIYSLSADHKTACYEALESALSLDPNLELVVFLSDGEPTAGRIVDPKRIVQAIALQNAAARVRIDTLGIDAAGTSETFLEELAAANFGSYRSLR